MGNDLSLVDFHNRFMETCAEIREACRIRSERRPMTPSDCTMGVTTQGPDAVSIVEGGPNKETPKPTVVEKTTHDVLIPLQSASATRLAELPDVISDTETSAWAKLDITNTLASCWLLAS